MNSLPYNTVLPCNAAQEEIDDLVEEFFSNHPRQIQALLHRNTFRANSQVTPCSDNELKALVTAELLRYPGQINHGLVKKAVYNRILSPLHTEIQDSSRDTENLLDSLPPGLARKTDLYLSGLDRREIETTEGIQCSDSLTAAISRAAFSLGIPKIRLDQIRREQQLKTIANSKELIRDNLLKFVFGDETPRSKNFVYHLIKRLINRFLTEHQAEMLDYHIKGYKNCEIQEINGYSGVRNVPAALERAQAKLRTKVNLALAGDIPFEIEPIEWASLDDIARAMISDLANDQDKLRERINRRDDMPFIEPIPLKEFDKEIWSGLSDKQRSCLTLYTSGFPVNEILEAYNIGEVNLSYILKNTFDKFGMERKDLDKIRRHTQVKANMKYKQRLANNLYDFTWGKTNSVNLSGSEYRELKTLAKTILGNLTYSYLKLFIRGYNYTDIAEITGSTHDSVKACLCKARTTLKESHQKYQDAKDEVSSWIDPMQWLLLPEKYRNFLLMFIEGKDLNDIADQAKLAIGSVKNYSQPAKLRKILGEEIAIKVHDLRAANLQKA